MSSPVGVKRIDAVAKIDKVVLEECKIAATFNGLSLNEYLSVKLAPIAKKDIEDAIAARAKVRH